MFSQTQEVEFMGDPLVTCAVERDLNQNSHQS
jgi:hypothetical protein